MILSIIYFILILGTIVLVHEFGHFFFAKLFGIYVYEFSIGMGPKLFGWHGKNKETLYSIRLIPIGGYCGLAGEGLEEDKKIPKDRLLQSKPVWQRFLVMFFGAGNNFILALIVLFLLGLFVGSSKTDTVIPGVIKGSPAEIAGIQRNDEITYINGKRTKTLDDVQLYLAIAKGETKFTLLRDGKEVNINLTPLEGEAATKAGYSYGIEFTKTNIIENVSNKNIGVLANDEIIAINGKEVRSSSMIEEELKNIEGNIELTILRGNQEEKVTLQIQDKNATDFSSKYGFSLSSGYKHGFINAVVYSFSKFRALYRQMFITIKELITGGVSLSNLSGPVGIYSAVDQTRSNGFSSLFYLLALLSLNVGFVNLIPFPAFDGGRILFLIIEKIKGKPVKAETENLIHNIGFIILIGLIIIVTINDIIRLF